MNNHYRSVCLACALSCVAVLGVEPIAAQPEKPAEPVLVTISKETTYITEPLTKSGYPDYVEALNQMYGKDVDPKTNAAVVLIQALGPGEISPEDATAPEFFRRLKIDPQPKQGDYVEAWEDYVKRLPAEKLPPATAEEKAEHNDNESADALEQAVRERVADRNFLESPPEGETEWKLLADWAAEQEKRLTRLERLRDCKTYYTPYVGPEKNSHIVAMLLPLVQSGRRAAFALSHRAADRIHRGDFDGAWNDAQTLFALSKLMGNTPTLVERLVAQAIQAIALDVVRVMTLDPRVDAARLTKWRKELAATIKPIRYDGALESGERFFFLDSVRMFAETGVEANFQMLQGKPAKPSSLKDRQKLDYDIMLRAGNGLYDRLTAIYRMDDRKKARDEMHQLDQEMSKLNKQFSGANQVWLLFATREQRSTAIADTLKALLTPAIAAVMQAETRAAQRLELVDTTIALRLYRDKHKTYPGTLEKLVPEFLTAVPQDRCADRPLTYMSYGQGFLLYSFGRNEVDDAGSDEDENDLSIYTPDFKPVPKPVDPGFELIPE